MKGDDPTKKVIPTLLGTGSVATATATISKVDPSEIVPARPEKNGSQSNNGQSKKRSKSRR
jgi:hypothetical protein